MRRMVAAFVLSLALAVSAKAQQINVEEFTLDNGMKFLLYPRTEQPNIIAAGWVAKVGSVNERPGITGISHFFEHMMFKGTNTIGTNDGARDAEFRAKQKAIRDQILKITWGSQYKRWKSGEIDDPWDPANDTDELAKLRGELKSLMDQHKDKTTGTIVKDEFDQVYTKGGASGMNAFTSEDVTFYFINVPSNKFELWAWLESDRLSDSVFREFFAERDVVHEERRLRTESTPTGIFQEQFNAMFWQSSPYNWPVIGWTSDLNSYTFDQAMDYFNIYYRPNNLVGVIVGDFKTEEIKPLIRRYFSRLERGSVEPPSVVTLEMKQMAEQRMNAECDCQPQIEVRYHTVPWNHADSFALSMMSDVLNSRTGRLYKSMIEGKKIASQANAFQNDQKYAGYFSFSAETKGDSKPEDLEAGWYTELKRLQDEEIGDAELQKVKNQVAADSYRRLQSNFGLLVQIGISEAFGGWQYINDSTPKLLAVTAADIKRVANKYFDKTNRSVALYYRKAGAGAAEDPEFAAIAEKIGPQMAQGLKRQLEMLKKMDNIDMLTQTVSQMETNKDQAPPEMAPVVEYMIKKVRERLDQLKK
ncbi:MAG TPA: pitrilysin family protein [Phycisphaerales bacterium]|nr:pitrilysin family protein [Phycisphaerales bacterium]